MRVAVLSDIHSNAPALEAALEAVGAFDQLWVMGDIVGYGPHPNEVVERLLKRAAIEGRSDDNEETIRHRIEVFHGETEPLVAYYGDRVRRVEGTGSVEDIFCRIACELAS